MPAGLILAGGKGTRLAPALTSKALVTVGQKPVLVHQYQQLRKLGCDPIVVVVSPDTQAQVEALVERCGIKLNILVQFGATGPGAAIHLAQSSYGLKDTYVLLADTYIDGDLPKLPVGAVAVAELPDRDRSWCYFNALADWWYEDRHVGGRAVAIGLYRLDLSNQISDGSLGDVLNELDAKYLHDVKGWFDTGDLAALERLSRGLFISRDFNSVTMNEFGQVVKRGADQHEIKYMRATPAPHLFPRLYEADEQHYVTEYVGWPTLAELYLYRPGGDHVWSHITRRLLERLRAELWCVELRPRRDLLVAARNMYVSKTYDRMRRVMSDDDEICVNGHSIQAGKQALEVALQFGHEAAAHPVPGVIHGDPNFTNVLWSLPTSTFKLVDPRGSFGGRADFIGDVRYDVAKVAYSISFAPIAHGLFTLKEIGPADFDFQVLFTCDSSAILTECYKLVPREQLDPIIALLFLSGAACHTGAERTAMYLEGLRWIERVLS